MNPDQTISLQTVNGWAILPSSLKHPDQSPRFHLHFLASLAGDVGAQHLIINEANAGYEPPTRDLLERVLRPGDLFVDVGAHWGFFSLQAATHPAGGVEVVAFEPDLTNATVLTENVNRNRLSNLVTVLRRLRQQERTGAARAQHHDGSQHPRHRACACGARAFEMGPCRYARWRARQHGQGGAAAGSFSRSTPKASSLMSLSEHKRCSRPGVSL
jgi:hypothetical protein